MKFSPAVFFRIILNVIWFELFNMAVGAFGWMVLMGLLLIYFPYLYLSGKFIHVSIDEIVSAGTVLVISALKIILFALKINAYITNKTRRFVFIDFAQVCITAVGLWMYVYCIQLNFPIHVYMQPQDAMVYLLIVESLVFIFHTLPVWFQNVCNDIGQKINPPLFTAIPGLYIVLTKAAGWRRIIGILHLWFTIVLIYSLLTEEHNKALFFILFVLLLAWSNIMKLKLQNPGREWYPPVFGHLCKKTKAAAQFLIPGLYILFAKGAGWRRIFGVPQLFLAMFAVSGFFVPDLPLVLPTLLFGIVWVWSWLLMRKMQSRLMTKGV